MANDIKELYGDYSPTPVVRYASTPFKGLQRLADQVTLASGCNNNRCNKYNVSTVKNATDGADVIIVCLGTGY